MKAFRFVFYIIVIHVLLVHCKKNDDNGITSKYYFSAEIDGQKIVFEDGKNGYGSGAGSSGSTVPAGYQEEQSLNIRRLSYYYSAGVAICKTVDAIASCSQIENMFYVGSYNYGKNSTDFNDNGIDGAIVYFVDENGVYWASDNGTGLQIGSNFEITEHIDNNDGFSGKITKAVFNCILYDGNGNSKVLTNGQIRSRSVTCGF